MKTLTVILILAATLAAQQPVGPRPTWSGTYANRPTSATIGTQYVVTDDASTGACTGGGSAKSTCWWDGSTWTALGGGGTTLSVTQAFSATPTFDISTVGQGGCIEMAAMTAPVTSVTFTNPSTGKFFCVQYLQDGTGGRIVTQSYNLTCLPTLAANIATRQWYVVKADGSTIEGNGCVSSQGTPAGVAVSIASPGSTSANVALPIGFTTTTWDTSSGALHSTSVTPSRFIATGVGVWHYRLTCGIQYVGAAPANYMWLFAGKNGNSSYDNNGYQVRGVAVAVQNIEFSISTVLELDASGSDYATCNLQTDLATSSYTATAVFEKLPY